MSNILTQERAETKARIKALKAKTKHEKLRKEAIECERELVQIKRPNIFKRAIEWLLS